MGDHNVTKHFRVLCPRCGWVQHPSTCYELPKLVKLRCERCGCPWFAADTPRPEPEPLTPPEVVPTE